jgi:pimeloyl-ACP methyl ester carboxylesterase
MTAPPQPPTLARRGPRPLPLHLMLAASRGSVALLNSPGLSPALPQRPATPTGWPNAWPNWNAGWPRSSFGRQEAARIGAALAAGGHRPEAFRAAVLRRLLREDRALLRGLAAYRTHPYQRRLPEPPVLWAEGGSRLLDYAPGAAGPVVVFVPSLVNKASVLDLDEGASLLRWLAAQGARPLLLDWGWPGPEERRFDLTAYVAGRLERVLMALPLRPLGPVVLAGYCMGGLLALAAAQRRPDRVRALALLATPWDFHAAEPASARALAALLPVLEPAMGLLDALPVEALQTLFAMLDPFAITEKFRRFSRLPMDCPAARRFVVLEDWLNDGVPLAAPVAREVLSGWYGANAPARGEWRIAGQAVNPAALTIPAFCVIPSRDRIVPPASAEALAAALPGCQVHRAAAGHIGMVAGSGAEAALWRPLRQWLDTLPLQAH